MRVKSKVRKQQYKLSKYKINCTYHFDSFSKQLKSKPDNNVGAKIETLGAWEARGEAHGPT